MTRMKQQNEWISTRLKNVAEVNARALSAITDDDYTLRYLEISNVNNRGIISEAAVEELSYIDAPSRAKRIVISGDTVISSVRPNLQAVAHIDQASDNFIASTGFYVVSPNQNRLNAKYIYYLLLSEDTKQYFEAVAKGVGYPAVDDKDFVTIKFLLPSIDQQRRIAAYLDKTCSAIDTAIDKKQKQLETLDALRKSIIYSVFTEKNDCPFERVKDVIVKIGSGVTPEGGASSYLDDGVPLLRSQNVHFDGLRLDDVAYISAETHAEMRSSQLQPRDVLLNITGASIGRCTFVPEGFGEGNVNQHVCIVRPGPHVDYRFLAAFLSSPLGQDQILSTFTGASRQGLSHKDLGLIRIPIPLVKAQREAVDRIEEHDATHRNLYGCIAAQIDTLTAYRKSLIHECVTGKRRITVEDMRVVQQY